MMAILVVLVGIAVCLGSVGQVDSRRLDVASHASAVDEVQGLGGANITVRAAGLQSACSVEPVAEAARVGVSRGVPSVEFFPNPVRDGVTFLARDVCWCSVRGLRVTLYDVSGGVIMEEVTGEAILETDRISELPNGLYVAAFEISVGGTWTRAGQGMLAVLH